MKCISDEIIQKFIDNETSTQEEAFVRSHISVCERCAERVKQIEQAASRIKKIMHFANNTDVEVPGFIEPLDLNYRIRNKYKKILYAASAACLVVFLLIVFIKRERPIEYYYSYEVENEFDANLPITEQEMVIHIIDSEGEHTSY